ncbi:unnamed protein product [Spodoptera littoralis]|uniref:Uncharacterized protein n=1 Tax=Spodoptera littoralis TaxID=7109 RepID=A0A9P0I0T1_SPOLI|nr:unnamed protein product [Spodoptera littoralis]CAH1636941.1 unnamed protein product [Spodoptera littoralis]
MFRCNMVKVTYIILFVVAVSLSSVQADDKNSKPEFNLDTIAFECAQKFDISKEQFSKAIMTFDASVLAPCFWKCCFMKVRVLNSEGQYDFDTTLNLAKDIFKNKDKQYEMVEEILKKCVSVNDESVSDGNAGCERSSLLASCMLENAKKTFTIPSRPTVI